MNRNLSLDAELMLKMEMFGFTMIGVMPEGKLPAFVYTIGLTQRGWPEVIMVGNVHPAIAEQLINDLIAGWSKKEKVIMGDNDGLLVFKDGTQHPIRVLTADANKALNDYACGVPNFFPNDELSFVQALIPDRFGRFPDEPDYDQSKQAQPLIK